MSIFHITISFVITFGIDADPAARICRASIMPAAKIKIGRRFVEGSEVAEYVLAKGSSAITGQGIMSKLGPCTLVGVVYSELGGTVPVYITTAWRGPLDNDGSPMAGSSARLMKAFEHMVSFVRFNVNRRGRCSLGAAAVPILNQSDKKSILFGPEHKQQDGQANTSFNNAALYEFSKCWKDPSVITEFCVEASFFFVT